MIISPHAGVITGCCTRVNRTWWWPALSLVWGRTVLLCGAHLLTDVAAGTHLSQRLDSASLAIGGCRRLTLSCWAVTLA